MKHRLTELTCAIALIGGLTAGAQLTAQPSPNPLNNLYWGDTHVHTMNSMDAYFVNNTTAGPDVAYRYAKGLPVLNASNGVRIRIGTPLDFLVVADHAEDHR